MAFLIVLGILFIVLGNKLEDFNHKRSGNFCLWCGLIIVFVGIIFGQ